MLSTYANTASLPDAACDSAMNHEAQAQTETAPTINRLKYRQRNIIERMFGWLRDSRHGHAGLHTAMPAAALFVQNLAQQLDNGMA